MVAQPVDVLLLGLALRLHRLALRADHQQPGAVRDGIPLGQHPALEDHLHADAVGERDGRDDVKESITVDIAEFNIPGLSPIGTADIIQVAITVLSFMWCLTVTKYPVACCLDRFTNAGLFTIVAAIVAVLDLINALEDFGRQWKKELFLVVAIVRILDLTVMVPITHWAVNTTYVLKQAFDEEKKYAPSAKVEPAKEEPKEEKK